MAPSSVLQRLRETGGRLGRWQAVRLGLLWLAGWLGLLWACTLLDLGLRFEHPGRIVCWLLLSLGLLGGAGLVVRLLRRPRTAEAVALAIERVFPQLDNHLINYVQFAGVDQPTVMQRAYLADGIPGWERLDLDAIKDRRGERRALLYACGVLLVTLLTAWWFGPAWPNAMLRLFNPFSARSPGALAQILAVSPGDGVVLRGEPLVLSLRTAGKAGQPVAVEVRFADDRKKRHKLGQLAGRGEEAFSYRIPAATADVEYRFFAADAVSKTYRVQALPPLALQLLEVTIRPPAYTKLEVRSVDVLKEAPVIPQGAQVEVRLEANRALAAAEAVAGTNAPTPFALRDRQPPWRASLTVTSDAPVRLTARDTYGTQTDYTLAFQLLADLPPVVRIVAPEGRPLLAAGASPRIQWEASDDYGLAAVALEQVLDEKDMDKNVALTNWPAAGRKAAALWAGDVGVRTEGSAPLVFRLIATDAQSHRSVSPLIRFDRLEKGKEPDRGAAAGEVAGKIGKIIELQRRNLARTQELQGQLAQATAEGWGGLRQTQQTIRELTGALLTDPAKPFGAQTLALRDLHAGPMYEAVQLLARVPETPAELRPAQAAKAVALEERILRFLTRAENDVTRTQSHKQITGLLAALEALITAQDEVHKATRKALETKTAVAPALPERQDRLAEEVKNFARRCLKEQEELLRTDKDFALLMVKAAEACEQKKINASMLQAAEQLEQNAPDRALPPQLAALGALREILAMLNQWRTADAAEKEKDLQEALGAAKQRLEKLTKLQAKVVENIRQTQNQKDKSQKEMEEIDTELGELKAQMAEALSKLATDLHIFPELPVGNDLVADVTQIYEEVKQQAGSEKAAFKETGLQKEDFILKAMEAASKRVDDMEMWLASAPDPVRRLTENFDKQEMPQIPVTPMATEMEDIIGDLLKQEEEIAEKAKDDSATNQGASDVSAGWGVGEGETTSYGAKGKSGNTVPKHKEQDGRSLVGRQGMANGETAAGSGKVNAGDEKIEKRRTQDSAQAGEVQEEGHAQAKATGGGKLSGFGEELGMAGMGPRRDANTKEGSQLGMQAMLRRNAESLYAKASMLHVRSGSLDEVVRSMREAETALAKGYPISEVREYQRRAIAALKKTQTELDGAALGATDISTGVAAPAPEERVAGGADEAPEQYRKQVAEYFKSLSEGTP